MKRYLPILMIFTGWFLAQVTGTPQQVYAQARTSLASLQAAIDSILNGNTTVGKAAHAQDSDKLGGIAASSFATKSELASFATEADLAALGIEIQDIKSTAVFHGQPVLVGSSVEGANASNAGMLRYNGATLQVSDGTYWREVQLEPIAD